MELLLRQFGYELPVWKLKKRIEVSLIEDEYTKLQICGVDETRQPFKVFRRMEVQGLGSTKVFPSSIQKKQPFLVMIQM